MSVAVQVQRFKTAVSQICSSKAAKQAVALVSIFSVVSAVGAAGFFMDHGAADQHDLSFKDALAESGGKEVKILLGNGLATYWTLADDALDEICPVAGASLFSSPYNNESQNISVSYESEIKGNVTLGPNTHIGPWYSIKGDGIYIGNSTLDGSDGVPSKGGSWTYVKGNDITIEGCFIGEGSYVRSNDHLKDVYAEGFDKFVENVTVENASLGCGVKVTHDIVGPQRTEIKVNILQQIFNAFFG